MATGYKTIVKYESATDTYTQIPGTVTVKSGGMKVKDVDITDLSKIYREYAGGTITYDAYTLTMRFDETTRAALMVLAAARDTIGWQFIDPPGNTGAKQDTFDALITEVGGVEYAHDQDLVFTVTIMVSGEVTRGTVS